MAIGLVAFFFRFSTFIAVFVPCWSSIAESFKYIEVRRITAKSNGFFSWQTSGSNELQKQGAAPESKKQRDGRWKGTRLLEAVSNVERGGMAFQFNRGNTTMETSSGDDKKTQEERIIDEYEFSPHRSKQIQGIANIMLFLGYQGIFFGWLKLFLGLFFIFTKRTPFRLLISDGFEVVSQLAEMYIAKLLRDGGLAFQRIVKEDGSDIDNLFKGLDSFKRIMNQNKTPTFVKWLAVISSILSLAGVFPKHFPSFDTFYHHI